MDNHVHLQQAAGTTKVVYNAYYDHRLAQQKDLTDFSDSRADKEFLIHERRDTEKDILKLKAYEKSLLAVSGVDLQVMDPDPLVVSLRLVCLPGADTIRSSSNSIRKGHESVTRVSPYF